MNELYLFIDESGNFDFSEKGSEFFILSAVVTGDPIQGARELLSVRHSILAAGLQSVRKPRECTHFHCSEDDQKTRDEVFAVIAKLDFFVYSVIVEKRKTNPSLRDLDKFYQQAFKALVPFIIRRQGENKTVHIFVSKIQLKSKAAAVTAGLKNVLNSAKGVGAYRLHFHPNHSHHMLQVSDYVCWAIARAWESKDARSHLLVNSKIVAEFDMFTCGTTRYY